MIEGHENLHAALLYGGLILFWLSAPTLMIEWIENRMRREKR